MTDQRNNEAKRERGPLFWPLGMAGCALLGVILALSPELYSHGRPLWQTSVLSLFFGGGSLVLGIAAYKMWLQKPNELWWMAAGFLVYALAAIVLYYLRQAEEPAGPRSGYIMSPMTPSTARKEDEGGSEKTDSDPEEKH